MPRAARLNSDRPAPTADALAVPKPPPTDVLGRFEEFAKLSRGFSRGILAGGRADPRGDPAELAARNLAIVRTVFSKWNLEILSLLYAMRRLGFEEIRRQLRSISAPVLSRKLRFLHDHGLLERTVISTPRIRVQYSLAPRGLLVAQLGEPVLLYLQMTDGRFPPAERLVARSKATN